MWWRARVPPGLDCVWRGRVRKFVQDDYVVVQREVGGCFYRLGRRVPGVGLEGGQAPAKSLLDKRPAV